MHDDRPLRPWGAALCLALGACAASGASRPAAEPPASVAAASASGGAEAEQPASRGRRFAEAHCSRCHAVGRPAISPNPEAPPFEGVANTPELTPATLTAWLRNSHDFPEVMRFDLGRREADDLAAHMLTLKED